MNQAQEIIAPSPGHAAGHAAAESVSLMHRFKYLITEIGLPVGADASAVYPAT